MLNRIKLIIAALLILYTQSQARDFQNWPRYAEQPLQNWPRLSEYEHLVDDLTWTGLALVERCEVADVSTRGIIPNENYTLTPSSWLTQFKEKAAYLITYSDFAAHENRTGFHREESITMWSVPSILNELSMPYDYFSKSRCPDRCMADVPAPGCDPGYGLPPLKEIIKRLDWTVGHTWWVKGSKNKYSACLDYSEQKCLLDTILEWDDVDWYETEKDLKNSIAYRVESAHAYTWSSYYGYRYSFYGCRINCDSVYTDNIPTVAPHSADLYVRPEKPSSGTDFEDTDGFGWDDDEHYYLLKTFSEDITDKRSASLGLPEDPCPLELSYIRLMLGLARDQSISAGCQARHFKWVFKWSFDYK